MTSLQGTSQDLAPQPATDLPSPGETRPPSAATRHLWVAYLAFGGILASLYFFLPAYHSPLWTTLGLSAVAATIVGVRRNQPRQPLAWYLLAAAELAFVAGDTTYNVLTGILHQDNPFPSVADLFYLLTYVLMAAGTLLLIRARSSARDLPALIDAVIITTGLGLLSWVYLIVPSFQADGLTVLGRATSVAYPVADVLILAMLARLVAGGGLRISSMRLLVSGALGLMVADVLYGLVQLNGVWHIGGPVDVGWVIFYLAWGAAALHPSMFRLSEVAPLPSVRVGRVRIALLASASLIAPGVLLLQAQLHQNTHATSVALFSAALFILVLARMTGILAAHAKLGEELHQRESQKQFRGMIQNASDIILVVDESGAINYATPSAERALGHPVSELLGRPLVDLLHPDEAHLANALISGLAGRTSQTPPVTDWRLRHTDGRYVSFEVLTSNLLDNSNVAGIVLTMRDVSQRRALEQQLMHQAFHDTLTGLPNRALFQDRVEHGLARAARQGTAVAMAMIDLDDFKVVNDNRGHAAGDIMLCEVARRLQLALRSSTTIARLGGDEFAILIEDLDDPSQIRGLAERIMEPFRTPFPVQDDEVVVSASTGVVLSGGSAAALTFTELLRCADLALYSAKERGKGRVEVYHDDLRARMVSDLTARSELSKAMEDEQFECHYQPIVLIDTGEIVGSEVLVRWRHPTRGLVMPAEFIALAEETGQIVELGRWVLDHACAQWRVWAELGHASHRLSVNVSTRQLQEPGFVDEVRSVLRRYNMAPAGLVLELTESVFALDGRTVLERLTMIRELGVRIAIDDFGTGFSSLSYLQQFRIDELKVDKSFVDGLGSGNLRQGALARAIVSMATSLRLEVVAEGIERIVQRDALWSMGCRLGQGWLYSKAVPPEQLLDLLTRGEPLGDSASDNSRAKRARLRIVNP